ALQEQIMTQRLLVAALVVLSLGCAALFAATWTAQAAQREALEAQQRQTELLIAELRQLAGRPPVVSTAPQQPAEWNRLTFRCLTDAPDNQPVAGVQIVVKGVSANAESLPVMVEVTDSNGVADFGQVLYGQY